MSDAFRLSVGTFSILRVPPPRRIDARTAAGAIALAPAIGAVLGLVAAGLVFLIRVGVGPDGSDNVVQSAAGTAGTDLLAAAVAVAFLALATRALHLDGLADTADGLGSARRGPDALDVMRRSDIGPFGVASIVLVLLVQTAALTAIITSGEGTVSLLVSCAVGRTAVVWACLRGIPAARADGLGATVAGVISPVVALAVTVVVLAVSGILAGFDDDVSPRLVLVVLAAVPVGIAAGLLLVRRCVQRFGGITGDVLGATLEVATTAALLVIAFS